MLKKKIYILSLSILTLISCNQVRNETGIVESTGLENGEFITEINGFKINYAVFGNGPVLMALPNSWGLSYQGLRALYKPLEANLTMVYFDPRGMGKSDDIRQDSDMSMAALRTDLDALRQHLGLEEVNVIGWSNGGMNLLLFASEYANTVDRAIFVHAVAYIDTQSNANNEENSPDFNQAWGDYFQMLSSTEITDEEKEDNHRNFTIQTNFPLMLSDKVTAVEVLEDLYSETVLSWQHMMYQFQDLAAYDARPNLPKITAKSLVIAGANDIGASVENVKAVADGIENSRFELFENSAHLSQIEEQEKFMALILEFLDVEK